MAKIGGGDWHGEAEDFSIEPGLHARYMQGRWAYALSTTGDGRVRIYAPRLDPERQVLTVDQALGLAQRNLQGQDEPWAQFVHGLLWQVREARWEVGDEARPTTDLSTGETTWPDE